MSSLEGPSSTPSSSSTTSSSNLTPSQKYRAAKRAREDGESEEVYAARMQTLRTAETQAREKRKIEQARLLVRETDGDSDPECRYLYTTSTYRSEATGELGVWLLK